MVYGNVPGGFLFLMAWVYLSNGTMNGRMPSHGTNLGRLEFL